MGQVPDQFTLEYLYDPVPDAQERYDAALDILIRLILADATQDPDSDSQTPSPEGVQ